MASPTADQIAKFKLFGQGQNPLYDVPSADQQNPAQQPATSVPDAPPARGSVSAAMPADQAQPAAQQPAFTPPANPPIASAPQPYQHGTLAKILLGVGEVLGNPFATRIGERDRARQQEVDEYTRQLPATQYAAQVGGAKTAAELNRERAQTEEAQQSTQRSKFEMGKEQDVAKGNAITQIMDEAQTGKYGDGPALATRWQRIASANPHLGLTADDIDKAISGTHPLGAKYTLIKGEGNRPEGLQDRTGKQYTPDQIAKDLVNDPEAQSLWTAAQQGHQQERTEKVADQKTVAGYAAERQAAGFVQQQTMDATKRVNDSVDTALGSDQRLSRMEKAYTKALKGDQQAMLSLLTDHIGMTLGLQKGAKITKDILNEAQSSQPLLAQIGAKFDSRGILSGATLGPDQMRQMLDLGYDARDQAYSSAHDTAKTYSVPLPKGMENVERKRVTGAKPLIEGQGGGQHSIAIGNRTYRYNGTGDTADLKNYTEVTKSTEKK